MRNENTTQMQYILPILTIVCSHRGGEASGGFKFMRRGGGCSSGNLEVGIFTPFAFFSAASFSLSSLVVPSSSSSFALTRLGMGFGGGVHLGGFGAPG